MKVLKNPDDLILAMHRKRLEYERDIGDADDVTRAKVAGCVIAVVHILTLVSAITFSRDFTEADMERPRKYAGRKERVAEQYGDRENVEAWLARGCVKGATWALKEIEKRMEE